MNSYTARLLLCAWLHDPPDKALQIQGHEQRTLKYLGTIIQANWNEIKRDVDPLAASIERMPVPPWDDAPQTKVDAHELEIKHLLTGQAHSKLADKVRKLSLDEQRVQELIAQLAKDLPRKYNQTGDAAKFLSLWRWLPEKMAEFQAGYAVLPADTRTPDHTIWHHMDTVAALVAACHDPQGSELRQERAAFLSFSVGPVQSFIATARSLRDLWSGSMILAYLTARAMEPVLEKYGPTAIIYPVLRGNPLIDVLWLKQKIGAAWLSGNQDEQEQREELARRLVPCLPNRFLAVVSRGPRDAKDQAEELAEEVRENAQKAWRDLANRVHNALEPKLSRIAADWDRHWQHAIENQFDFRTVVLPWFGEQGNQALAAEDPQAEGNPDRLLMQSLAGNPDAPLPQQVEQLRQFARELAPRFHHDELGRWQLRLELLGRLGQADKLLRKVPQPLPVQNGQKVPPKCSMTGETEAMGPAELSEFRKFWNQLSGQNGSQPLSIGGVRIRRGERLGSVALVKRFAGPVVFAKEFDLDDRRLLRMADTATVAARCWLERAKEIEKEDSETGFDFESKVTWADQPNAELAWSGHWLHWHDREEAEEDERPPKKLQTKLRKLIDPDCLGQPPIYYAVLMMDGDRLGQWLRGKLSPEVLESYHSKLLEYLKQQGLADRPGLNQPRPVTPAFHMAISEALANFSLYFVPKIVEKHLGQLVYAGGDDVLALLPLETALSCAAELNETYRKPWKKDKEAKEKEEQGIPRLLMGPQATMSAALVVAHFKDDLRSVLQAARSAEKRAKSAGRNVLQLVIRRRSGEHSAALCPWEFVRHLHQWHQVFAKFDLFDPQNPKTFRQKRVPASDRWIYQLRRILPGTAERGLSLPLDAIKGLFKRQIQRAERQTQQLVALALATAFRKPVPQNNELKEKVAELLVQSFDEYYAQLKPQERWSEKTVEEQEQLAVQNFLTLWQAASFLARGRDA